MDDYQNEQRLGNREPRSKLLPPYLRGNPYFTDLADAIDTVWSNSVQPSLDVIKHLRHMWVSNPVVEAKIDNSELIDLDDWTRPERALLVKQVNLLGMKLKSAGLLTDQNYLTVSRFLGMYWFGKGTQDFVQFINFALILDLEVYNLWSQREPEMVSGKIATKAQRAVRLYITQAEASGYVFLNGTILGIFYNAQPDTEVQVQWQATEYNPNGDNIIEIADEGNWDQYNLVVQLFDPAGITFSYPLLDVPDNF